MDPDISTVRRPSMFARIVWLLFSIVMWAWAVLGPLALAISVLSYFFDWAAFEGAPGRDRAASIEEIVIISAVGLAFAFLRWQGYLRFGDRDY